MICQRFEKKKRPEAFLVKWLYTVSKINQKPHGCILTIVNVFSLVYTSVLTCGKLVSARMDVRGGALHNILFNRVLSRHEERTGAELFESRLFPPLSEEFEQLGPYHAIPI